MNSGYSGQVRLPSARAAAATLVQFYNSHYSLLGPKIREENDFLKIYSISRPKHFVLWSSAFKLLGVGAAFDEAIHVIKSVKKTNYFGEGENVPNAVGRNFKGVVFFHVLNCGQQLGKSVLRKLTDIKSNNCTSMNHFLLRNTGLSRYGLSCV